MSNDDVLRKSIEDKKNELKNSVFIYINVYGRQYSQELIKEWFTTFCYFKPYRMSIYSGVCGKTKRYNSDIFDKELMNTKNTSLALSDRSSKNCIEARITRSTGYFYIKMPTEVLKNVEKKFISDYERIFINLNACFGYIVNSFDDYIVQNPKTPDVYERFNINQEDFLDIDKVELVPCNTYKCGYKIDTSYLPGYRLYYDEMIFTTAPYMWIGPDYYKFFSKENVDTYSDCDENIEIAPGFRRIRLWKNVDEYNNSIYRKRQWCFRKTINMDEVIKNFNNKPFMPKDEKSLPDPTMEINKGKFEHGGELFVKYYFDKKGRACNKSLADICICREMKGNTIVWQERKKL